MHARSVLGGVRSGSKHKITLLDNLIMTVGILGNLPAVSPLYHVCEEFSFVIFKKAVVLT